MRLRSYWWMCSTSKWRRGTSNRMNRCSATGWGLDSIDALEIALAISRTYGFELKSDDARAHHVFESLRSLTRYIDTHRIR